MRQNIIKKVIRQTTRELACKTGGDFCVPELVYLKLTENCNFHCQHCDIWRNPAPNLPLGDWQKIILGLKDLDKNLAVTVSGGEPLLYPDFWPLMDFLKRNGVGVSLNTNGSLIDAAAAEKLTQDPFRKVEVSLFTLKPEVHDRLRQTPGAYEKSYRALQLLGEAKKQNSASRTEILTAFLLTKENAGEAADFVEHFSRQGIWTSVQSLDTNIQPLFRDDFSGGEPSPAENELWIKDKAEVRAVFAKLKELKRRGALVYNRLAQLEAMEKYYLEDWPAIGRLPCRAGWKNLIVSSHGDVFLCFKGPAVGSLLKGGAREIWHPKRARGVRRQMKDCQKMCRVMNCNYNNSLFSQGREYLKKKFTGA